MAVAKLESVRQKMEKAEYGAWAAEQAESFVDGGSLRAQAKVNARAGCLQIVFALKDYKTEHGEYPDSLDQLTKELPLDPFSGKPFLYRKEADGFIVYSVGKNETDDGGDGKNDIVWRCAK